MTVQVSGASQSEELASEQRLRAYQVLQLKAGAPRALVEEAYWALIKDVQRTAMGDGAYGRLIAELNEALERVSLDLNERANNPDAPTEGPRRNASFLGRRPKRNIAAEPAPSPYEVLNVHEDATAEVVRLAAGIAMNKLSLPGTSKAQREQIITACQSLTDPLRRAEVDGSVAARETVRAPLLVADTVARGPVSIDETGRRTADKTDQAPAAPAPVIKDAAANNHGISGAAPPPAGVAASSRPQPFLPATANGSTAPEEILSVDAASQRVVDVEDALAPAALDVLVSVPSLAQPPGSAPIRVEREASPVGPTAQRGLLDRAGAILHRKGSYDAADEAANDRLLALCVSEAEREDARQTPVAKSRAIPSVPRRSGPSLIYTKGTHAGTSTSLGHLTAEGDERQTLEVLLANVAGPPTRVSIWCNNDHFLLQHLDGPPPSISGAPLVLPIVVLDQGDVVETNAAAVSIELGVGT